MSQDHHFLEVPGDLRLIQHRDTNSAAMVTKLLASDADIEEIRARDGHSRKMGVNSVPTFIVAQQHAVPGAQPPEMWLKVMADIMEQIAGAE